MECRLEERTPPPKKKVLYLGNRTDGHYKTKQQQDAAKHFGVNHYHDNKQGIELGFIWLDVERLTSIIC